MQIVNRCLCGTTRVTYLRRGKRTARELEQIVRDVDFEFRDHHRGPQCGLCDAKTARRIRAQARRRIGKQRMIA